MKKIIILAFCVLFFISSALAGKEGINEQLKAKDQLVWVGAMNNIRNRWFSRSISRNFCIQV